MTAGGAITQETLDPQAQALLDHMAAEMAKAPMPDRQPTEAERIAVTRRGYLQTIPLAGEPEQVARIEDRSLTGPGGPIAVRLYQPRG